MHRMLAALALSLAAGTCLGAYPDRPIRFIVPFVPGGALDTVDRIVGLMLAPCLARTAPSTTAGAH